MLVSVVVPVYNVESYLRRCLDSLRMQTLKDIQVVCVDDGSTDGSLAILREYEAIDSRFKIITKSNAGYGHSMNQGFAAAEAEYVGVLESDDFCSPTMCETLYRLARDCNADIVRSDIMLYWSEPEEREELARFVIAGKCGYLFDPRKLPQCFLLPPALCSMLVKRSLIVDNDLRMLETPGASYQDTSFSFKLWACARRAVMTSEAFVRYRQDNAGSSINRSDKLYCVPDEYSEIERFLLSDKERFSSLFPVMIARKFGAYIWNYKRIAPESHLEFARFASKEFAEAFDEGFVDQDLFSSNEWSDLMLLVEDPMRFVDRMDSWGSSAVGRFHARARLARKLGMGK